VHYNQFLWIWIYYIKSNNYYLQRLQHRSSDIPQFANLSVTTARKLKRLLLVIADSVPFKPNFVSLAAKLEVSRNSLEEYMSLMEDAGLIARLRDQSDGIISLGKIDKIYLDNTN